MSLIEKGKRWYWRKKFKYQRNNSNQKSLFADYLKIIMNKKAILKGERVGNTA
jgi:hypothetical protein